MSLVVSSNSWSATFSKQIWSKGDFHYLFNYQSENNILISENCFNEDINLSDSKCAAALALKKRNSLTLPKDALAGGKNPGAVVCSTALNKEVLILKNSKNDENSFCAFEDGSMISAINLQSLLKE